MNREQLINYAVEEGFAKAEIIETKDILFDPSFRKYCEENTCGQYNINYSCPPRCGTPEEMKQKILVHKYALVLQSSWNISDYTDMKALKNAKDIHNLFSQKLMKRLKAEGCDGFVVGTSGCSLCSTCAFQTGEPCRHPEQRSSGMSAYCIAVMDLAEKCGMSYSWKEETLSYYGMYVFD